MSSHGSFFLKRNGEGRHIQKVLYHSALVVGSANRDFIPYHDTMIIALKYSENIYNKITYSFVFDYRSGVFRFKCPAIGIKMIKRNF